MKKPLGLQDFLVAIIFLVFLSFKLEGFAADPGLGWHIRTGEFILSHFSLPKTDIFLYPQQNTFWVIDQWLSDWLFAVILKAGNWSLLYACLLIYYLYTFIFLLYEKLKKFSGTYLLTSFTLIIVCTFAQVHFICRPVILSFLPFLILFFEFFEIQNTQKKPDFIKIFLTGLLWANLHPSFILVWLLFLCLVVTEKKLYWKTGLVLLLSTLCTPYHLQLYFNVIWLSISQIKDPIYTEWQSAPLGILPTILFLLPALLLIILKILRKIKLRDISPFLLITFMLLCLASVKSVRFFPYFAITAAPLLVISGKAFLGLIKHPELLVQAFKNLELRESQTNCGKKIFFLLSALTLISAIFFNISPLGFSDFGYSKNFPYKAMDILKKQPGTIKVLNDMNYGGFITYYGEGKVKAFYDDRTTLHGVKAYKAYEKFLAPEYIFAYARMLDVDYLLLANSSLHQKLVDYIKKCQKPSLIYADAETLLMDLRPVLKDKNKLKRSCV